MHLTMHGQRYRAPKTESLAKFQILNFKVNQTDAKHVVEVALTSDFDVALKVRHICIRSEF